MIGEKLRIEREKKGLSLVKLSLVSGVSRSQIWKVEKNLIKPTLYILEKLANGLQINLKNLLEKDSKSKYTNTIIENMEVKKEAITDPNQKAKKIKVEQGISFTLPKKTKSKKSDVA